MKRLQGEKRIVEMSQVQKLCERLGWMVGSLSL